MRVGEARERNIVFAFSMLASLCVATSAAQAQDARQSAARAVPQYGFRVGQQLHYQQLPDENLLPRSSDGVEEPSLREYRTHWWLWVTRQEDDGGWRVLIRKQLTHVVTHPGKPPATYFENAFFGYCDLRPDGSYDANPSLGGHRYFKTHPDEVISRLPPDAAALRNGWQYASPLDGARYIMEPTEREDDLLQLAALVERPEDRVQQYRMIRRVDFDVSRGLVVRIVDEYESKQANHAFHVRRPFELISVEQRSQEWLASLVSESERCLAAQADAFALLEKASCARTKADCQAAMDQSRDRLVVTLAKSKLPEVQEALEAALTLQAADAERESRAAANREQLFAAPPADWESTDFDGQTHRQVDYRGKIVLMDFWYRGCTHCIRAMPIIKKLVAHYQGKDVVVLGINVDENDQDARQVIASCELSYPNLRGKDISQKYHVNAYPTLIVLDQSGRIAAFPHVENNGDLFEHITNIVDGLLEHRPTK